MVEYIIENCTGKEIDKLLQSDILWYPDNITSVCSDQNTDVCFESEEDVDRALILIGRKKYA